MVLQRAAPPPPPRPWNDVPEVEYRLYKNPIKMGRSFNSVMVSLKRLIARESASESGGTQFVTDDDEVHTADGTLHVHKIPQLPVSKHKYFIVVMFPPDDLEIDDIPMEGCKEVKFLFSFYNLYLTGFTYDDKIWHVFDDAMIVGISEESREMYVKKLGFPGDYNTLKQNYLELDVGFRGQCDTYNMIVGRISNKTTEDQLIRGLCRTTITLPESARFAFLAQFHLGIFHSGSFDAVLDMLVVEGEEYRNFSLHLTKWGTYSTMSKLGKKYFNASVIPTSGIQSFSGLLNFIAIATNKKYDEESYQLKHEVEKKPSTDDVDADKKGSNQGQDKDNEESEHKKADQNDGETWFYQAPLLPYVPQGRQTTNLDGKADVDMRAMLEIHRKAPLKELSWTLLLQLSMCKASKYVKEKLSVKVDKLGKDSLMNYAKTSMSPKLFHTDIVCIGNMVVEAVQAVKTANCKGEVKYPIKSISNVLKRHAKSAKQSCLLNGYALNSHRTAQGMPTRVTPDGIACIDKKIRQKESNITKEQIEKVLKAHANFVFTTNGIDDMSLKYFVEAGSIAVTCVRKEDSRPVAKATDATTVATFADMEGEETFDPTFLKHGYEADEERISSVEIILVKGTSNTSAVSVILRGANGFMLDEIELSLHDALFIVKRTLDSNMITGGGGALEAALSVYLVNQATALESREQLAIAEFAESLLKAPDELTLEGHPEWSGMAMARLVECLSQQPLCCPSTLGAVDDTKCVQNWYAERAQQDPWHHDRYPLGRLAAVA